MASMDIWFGNLAPNVRVLDAKEYERCIVIGMGAELVGALRLTSAEAAQLRDDLSRAVTEAARNSALDVAATEEAAAAIARAATGETP